MVSWPLWEISSVSPEPSPVPRSGCESPPCSGSSEARLRRDKPVSLPVVTLVPCFIQEQNLVSQVKREWLLGRCMLWAVRSRPRAQGSRRGRALATRLLCAISSVAVDKIKRTAQVIGAFSWSWTTLNQVIYLFPHPHGSEATDWQFPYRCVQWDSSQWRLAPGGLYTFMSVSASSSFKKQKEQPVRAGIQPASW